MGLSHLPHLISVRTEPEGIVLLGQLQGSWAFIHKEGAELREPGLRTVGLAGDGAMQGKGRNVSEPDNSQLGDLGDLLPVSQFWLHIRITQSFKNAPAWLTWHSRPSS